MHRTGLAILAFSVCVGHPTVHAAVQDEQPQIQRGNYEGRRAREAAQQRLEAERHQQMQTLQGLARGAAAVAPSGRPAGLSEDQRRANALNDLMAYAGELEQLMSYRSVAVLNDGVREELAEQAERSLEAGRRVLDYVNRGSEPPPPGTVHVPDEPLGDRIYRLADVYSRVLEPTVQVILGDVLDLDALRQARAGFAAMDALIRAVPDSHTDVEGSSQPPGTP